MLGCSTPVLALPKSVGDYLDGFPFGQAPRSGSRVCVGKHGAAEEPLSLFRKQIGMASPSGLCRTTTASSLRAVGWRSSSALILPAPHLLWHHPLPVEPSSFPLNNFLSVGPVAVCQLCSAAGARGSLLRHGCPGIALRFGSRCQKRCGMAVSGCGLPRAEASPFWPAG